MAVSSGHRSVSRRSPPGQRSAKNRSSPGECATGAASRSSPTMSDIASDPQRHHGKIPQSRALRRVIHRRRSCPNWDIFGVKCPLIPWGSNTTPRCFAVVSTASCVSVPRSVIAGLFFGSTLKRKSPWRLSGSAKGFVVFRGTRYFQPQCKRSCPCLTAL